MSRLPRLKIQNLNDEQRTFVKSLTDGKRAKNKSISTFTFSDGSLKGPFNAWLYSTKSGERAQKLGEHLRFDSAIPGILREVAILSVAAHWKSQYEWWAHEQIALKEGLSPYIIRQLKEEKIPQTTDGAIVAVARFVWEALDKKQVSDDVYSTVLEHLGERGVVDLTILIGYYCLVSASLNIFKVPIPDGEVVSFNH
ncbi:MAG: 4-carboxymuconolactone decarboxylase [Magnetovibrio sp.]|nr:4-carboxymuconolactone decarboxylase [Magnetovibrio sp.]|tara:strand:+ start:720 stop:1310 length:591 start_codon:yes stop_codon:yes gene_type:complete